MNLRLIAIYLISQESLKVWQKEKRSVTEAKFWVGGMNEEKVCGIVEKSV